ncbi:glutathione S-transferase [Mycena crocata]|nr:glutathione S-transferase [Mycena crocata]
MVIKLYASPKITQVSKLPGGPNVAGGGAVVALVLAEKQIPFEFIPIDMVNGGSKTPEFLAKQPFGQVPVIDDDGFILYESRAICRYLVEKYPGQGPRLVPTSLQERALFEQAASVEFANFHFQAFKIVVEALGKPHNGLPVDQALLSSAISQLSATLDVYDTILGRQKFLAGNEFTLVDTFHLFHAHFLASAGIDIMMRKPHVARWWTEVVSRPAWVKLQEEGMKSTAA